MIDTQYAGESLVAASDPIFDLASREIILGCALGRERQRIAAELHDSVAQQLCALRYWVEGAKSPNHQTETASQPQANELPLSLIDDVLSEHRRIIERLSARTPDLELERTLDDLCSHWQSCTHNAFRIVFDCAGDLARLQPELELSILRITQESVSNAVRHSGGDQIAVELKVRAERVCLRIQDNGNGFVGSEETAGYGLANMKRRAMETGGVYVLHECSTGTGIEVYWPLLGAKGQLKAS